MAITPSPKGIPEYLKSVFAQLLSTTAYHLNAAYGGGMGPKIPKDSVLMVPAAVLKSFGVTDGAFASIPIIAAPAHWPTASSYDSFKVALEFKIGPATVSVSMDAYVPMVNPFEPPEACSFGLQGYYTSPVKKYWSAHPSQTQGKYTDKVTGKAYAKIHVDYGPVVGGLNQSYGPTDEVIGKLFASALKSPPNEPCIVEDDFDSEEVEEEAV